MEQVEWGEFKLWSLFDVDSWIYWKNKQYNTRISDPTDNSIAVVSWITENNWVNYYTEDKLSDDEIFEWELTISTRWEYSWTVFYHNKKFVLANNILVMFMPWLTKNQKLFIWSIINSLSYWWYSWYPRKETLKEDMIQLPVKNWKIDFEFMDKFIAELEAEHQAELEAYLETTWLKNCELTSDELKALNDFEEWKTEWKIFKIWWENGLFTINSYKKRFDANKVNILNYWKPYIVRTANNNWLRWYLDEDEQFLNDWNTISFGQDTATMFYQEEPYFTWDKIKIIKSKDNKFNKSNAHFFITSMWKAFSSFARWQSSFNTKIIENQDIYLPTKDNKPDYELMETFISAIQKLVIKDVVIYNQERLKATKEVINK